MEKNLKNFIKKLSEVYDKDSEDSFISMYLNKETYQKQISERKKIIESILKEKTLENFKRSFENIEDILKKENFKNLAVFSSNKNNFIDFVKLPVNIKNQFILDSSPYLRPLARILDEWDSFSLLLLNSNSAVIYSISIGEIKDSKKLSKDIMNKHKKGGCSQKRFNRLRRGAIKDFFNEIIEEIQKRSNDKIIIAGPGTAKNQFIDILPKNLSDKIIDTIDISIEDQEELLSKSLKIIAEKEKQTGYNSVNALKSEILKDGLAVYGIKETLKAVRNGQIELLLIQKDYSLKGWICEKCQAVEEGKSDNCPYCKNKTSEIDMIEEIIEFAERTDAEIEFTDSEEISKLGHVGGFLRFK